MKQLGLIVNPMAGIGGRVGLKGSDGEEIRMLAFSLGAVQEAPGKVVRSLKRMKECGHEVHIITCPGSMGEEEAREAGYDPEIIEGISTDRTIWNPEDGGYAGSGATTGGTTPRSRSTRSSRTFFQLRIKHRTDIRCPWHWKSETLHLISRSTRPAERSSTSTRNWRRDPYS